MDVLLAHGIHSVFRLVFIAVEAMWWTGLISVEGSFSSSMIWPKSIGPEPLCSRWQAAAGLVQVQVMEM